MLPKCFLICARNSQLVLTLVPQATTRQRYNQTNAQGKGDLDQKIVLLSKVFFRLKNTQHFQGTIGISRKEGRKTRKEKQREEKKRKEKWKREIKRGSLRFCFFSLLPLCSSASFALFSSVGILLSPQRNPKWIPRWNPLHEWRAHWAFFNLMILKCCSYTWCHCKSVCSGKRLILFEPLNQA